MKCVIKDMTSFIYNKNVRNYSPKLIKKLMQKKFLRIFGINTKLYLYFIILY